MRYLTITVLTLLISSHLLASDVSLTTDGKVPGKPFQVMQEQIDSLNVRVAANEASIDVNTTAIGGLGGGTSIGSLAVKHDGVTIGKLFPVNSMLVINEKAFVLDIDRWYGPVSVFGINLTSLYYKTTDCSGQAFLSMHGPYYASFSNIGLVAAYTNKSGVHELVMTEPGNSAIIEAFSASNMEDGSCQYFSGSSSLFLAKPAVPNDPVISGVPNEGYPGTFTIE